MSFSTEQMQRLYKSLGFNPALVGEALPTSEHIVQIAETRNAEDVALRKENEYYERLHILRKKAKLALNLRICGLRDQLRDAKAKSKDYEHNWHLTCTEVKELRAEVEEFRDQEDEVDHLNRELSRSLSEAKDLRAENEKLKNEHEINLKDWNWHLSEFATEIADLRTENAEWKRAHDEHDCTATVDVGGEIERLKSELEKAAIWIKRNQWRGAGVCVECGCVMEHAKGCKTAALLSGLDSADDSTWSDPLNTGEGIPQVRIVEEKDESV